MRLYVHGHGAIHWPLGNLIVATSSKKNESLFPQLGMGSWSPSSICVGVVAAMSLCSTCVKTTAAERNSCGMSRRQQFIYYYCFLFQDTPEPCGAGEGDELIKSSHLELRSLSVSVSHEYLSVLLLTAQRSFSDQAWVHPRSEYRCKYLEDNLTVWSPIKITIACSNLGPITSLAMGFWLAYSTRHELLSVDCALNPIRKWLVYP